ncbi:neutral zinc metallopeptidase [Novosphingobium sp. KCTC 2891]|uniref:KPN_02809 family neutral zinc metallopeptidase n=1 Tax=Novosphingobium sp. KCTC 2891 TaxID=2989730 RepID=UPI002222CE81|nr:neutral zinc metallopeptidase [Novosphingobium sp. KCTC 2891]MCW1384168.1 neutral zinc metallopeptidase [Novosphingobium sp. KCTC 2891]
MRLDDYDDSIRVEDQRGRGGGFGGGGGGLPFGLLSLIGSRFGIGGIIVVVIGMALFGGLGNLLGGGQQGVVGGPVASGPTGAKSIAESCNVNAFSHESCNALASLNHTWEPILAKAGINAAAPKLVFYSQAGQSGCGAAQSAMGPFYCPTDQGIYIDTDFYTEMDKKMGAGGDFARAYVMAHEYGHHIQSLTGLSDQVHQAQQRDPSRANQLSVRLELQADCYAGVWAAKNRDRIEPGDLEEGLRAAHQIGDDTLMKAAGRRPVEAAFTHGSAAQRMTWLRKGLDTGNEDQCDTFADMAG